MNVDAKVATMWVILGLENQKAWKGVIAGMLCDTSSSLIRFGNILLGIDSKLTKHRKNYV